MNNDLEIAKFIVAVNALVEQHGIKITYERASCKILVFPRTFFSKQSCADTIRPFAVEIF